MNITKMIEERAKAVCPKIIFPESDEPEIVKLAALSAERGIAAPVLLGNKNDILELAEKHQIELKGVKCVSLSDEDKQKYAELFSAEDPDNTVKMVLRKLRDPLFQAALLVHYDQADSFIAGYSHTSGDVILAASMFIGKEEGINTISSINVVTIPGFEGSEGENVIFTDVAVAVRPEPDALAEIAILAADATQKLLGWEPRVAFISYSTKGSNAGPEVDRVLEGLKILRERRPDIKADGEFQLEVALSEKAAKKKIKDPGEVAGRANIVVFPDINTGNTNIKSVKLFSNANSIGPILTGFKKTVSDLSRTGSIEHRLGTVAAIASLCRKEQ